MRNRRKKRSGHRKILRSFIKFAVVQIVILLFFFAMLHGSRTPERSDLKQADIVVDQIQYVPAGRIKSLSVSCGSGKYKFDNTGKIGEYSNYELYEAIKVGDKLSVTYYEGTHLFRKVNWVVSAWDESVMYRSEEAYLESNDGVLLAVCVIFGVIELALIGALIGFCLFHKKEIKKTIKGTGKKTSD